MANQTSSLVDPITTILRSYLVNVVNRGLNPPATATTEKYPVYEAQAPNTPDKCMILFETAKVKLGRYMYGGELVLKHGCQIQIRNPDYVEGHGFVNKLTRDLTEKETGPDLPFTLASPSGTGTYVIRNIETPSGSLHLGVEPENRRHMWSLNLLITLNYVA